MSRGAEKPAGRPVVLTSLAWLALAAAALPGCNCDPQGAAGTVAIDITGLGASGFNYTQGSYVVGFVFRPRAAIRLTELGYYDPNLTGKTETFGAHPVGVYDLTTSTLAVSATVQPSDPATGPIRYRALGTPLALDLAHTYAVVGLTGTNSYAVGLTAAEAPVNANLQYVSGAGYSTTANNNQPTQTTTLIQPNAFDVGNIFGQVPDAGVLADFGPDFIFQLAQ